MEISMSPNNYLVLNKAVRPRAGDMRSVLVRVAPSHLLQPRGPLRLGHPSFGPKAEFHPGRIITF